jgi:hypothetical protein
MAPQFAVSRGWRGGEGRQGWQDRGGRPVRGQSPARNNSPASFENPPLTVLTCWPWCLLASRYCYFEPSSSCGAVLRTPYSSSYSGLRRYLRPSKWHKFRKWRQFHSWHVSINIVMIVVAGLIATVTKSISAVQRRIGGQMSYPEWLLRLRLRIRTSQSPA